MSEGDLYGFKVAVPVAQAHMYAGVADKSRPWTSASVLRITDYRLQLQLQLQLQMTNDNLQVTNK